MSKILSFFGLAKASDVKKYKSACNLLGTKLEACSTDVLGIPDNVAKLNDTQTGKTQEMHIDVGGFCSDIYHRYSPGVHGFNSKDADELIEFLNV